MNTGRDRSARVAVSLIDPEIARQNKRKRKSKSIDPLLKNFRFKVKQVNVKRTKVKIENKNEEIKKGNLRFRIRNKS